MKAKQTLQNLAKQIGVGVNDLSFEIQLEGKLLKLEPENFGLTQSSGDNGELQFIGQWGDIQIRWLFMPWQGGYWVSLQLDCQYRLGCSAITSLAMTYSRDDSDLTAWRTLNSNTSLEKEGIKSVKELADGPVSSSNLSGVFPSSQEVGLFLGTEIPQICLHRYQITHDDQSKLLVACTTIFPEGFNQKQHLESEKTWVCANKTVGDAIDTYADHLPKLDPKTAPPIGWNSWDYYFRAVDTQDILENADAIRANPKFAEKVEYIILDDGWATVWGEWHPNHRFAEGIHYLAAEIEKRGFIPGIWTAPVAVHTLSHTASRQYQFLIKDVYGDPIPADFPEHFILDPTHPDGEAFLREVYTRLHQAGFRYFKLDFVDELLRAERFHDPNVGHYDVLRRLFTIIRECVTNESHILGCSLPEECGPGYADTGRIGIDIHNQWSHVEWVADYFQTRYWVHNRIWISDPDFLVVRGLDTTPEVETNVLNPKANNPNPPRWRRGPVFNLAEAQTWTNLVALSGGAIFFGDRMNQLNEKGNTLLKKILAFNPTGVAAKPLDLCDAERASFWLQELDDEYRLGVINWDGTQQTLEFDFVAYGLSTPVNVTEIYEDVAIPIKGSQFEVDLDPHASLIVRWKK